MARKVTLIFLTLAGVLTVVAWIVSHSARPTFDLYVTPQSALGLGLEPGRLLLGRWHIEGDMDWLRLADRIAARLSYRINPTDDGFALDPNPNPPPDPDRADQSRLRWDILIGDLPVPAPHLRFDTYEWTRNTASAWTGRVDYAVLPLWVLPWPLLAWLAWAALRRLRSREAIATP